MGEVIFITLEEVLAIHKIQIDKWGGSHGVRDFNLLLSALGRPQATFGGIDLYINLFDKASSLLHSLIFNHAFVDGNKRTAIVTTARFIFINGYKLQASNEELINLVLKTETKKWNLEKISFWLKSHSGKI